MFGGGRSWVSGYWARVVGLGRGCGSGHDTVAVTK